MWISGNLGGAAGTGITFWLKLRPEKPLKSTSTVAQEDSIGSCLKLTKRTTKVAFKIQAISLLLIITFSLTFQECVLTWLLFLFLPFWVLAGRLSGLIVSAVLLFRRRELWLSLAVISFALPVILSGVEIAALTDNGFTSPFDPYLWLAGNPFCCSLLDLFGWGILGAGLFKRR